MFSGIVETTVQIQTLKPRDGLVQLMVDRPPAFTDISTGDSVAVNGVCLTIESFTDESMTFVLGKETLAVTGWSESLKIGTPLNVERSLKLGDRIHGHWVTGHAEGMGVVQTASDAAEWRELEIQFPSSLRPLIWKKGSITVNGVSLTVNRVQGDVFHVGLIPETLKRTNLSLLKAQDLVSLEPDFLARGLVHLQEIKNELHT